jgi:hypothetical protein
MTSVVEYQYCILYKIRMVFTQKWPGLKDFFFRKWKNAKMTKMAKFRIYRLFDLIFQAIFFVKHWIRTSFITPIFVHHCFVKLGPIFMSSTFLHFKKFQNFLD